MSFLEREEELRELFKRSQFVTGAARRSRHKVRAEESNGALGGNDYSAIVGANLSRSTRHPRAQPTQQPTTTTQDGETGSAGQSRRALQDKRRKQRQDDEHFAEVFPDLHGKRVPPVILAAEEEETKFRHSGWAHRRSLILQALIDSGANDRTVEAFKHCGANAWVCQYTDEKGGWVIKCQRCKNRWCRPCGNARALLIADRLEEKLDEEPHLHVVLTLKHVDQPLSPQVDRLYASFKKLRNKSVWVGRPGHCYGGTHPRCTTRARRQRWRAARERLMFSWKNHTDGGAAFFQSKIGQDNLWHPHLHIICRGKWINHHRLSLAWKAITGDSTNVHVSKVADRKSVVREVTRYVSQPADKDTVTDPERLREMIEALAGRHLCFTFGRWRKFRLTAKSDEPHRPHKPVISLVDLIAKRNRGDPWATKLYDVLTAKSGQTRAPPHRAPTDEG